MKKKFGLWLNIVTICLCVCAIAIGVYAATNATLTISGQIGFEAHGLTFTATARAKGYAESADATTYVKEFGDPIAMSGDKITLPAMYFSDLVEETIPSIVIEISITNGSLFPIEALLSLPTATAIQSNITFEVDNGLLELPATTANDDTDVGTITITMTLKNNQTEALKTPQDLEFTVALNKYTQIKHDTTEGASYYYVNMGSTVVTKDSVQQVQPLRWYAFAKKDTGDAFDTYSKTTALTSGTYYFVSENALLVDDNNNGVVWGTYPHSGSETDNYGLDYGTAPINALVNGEGEGSVFAEYDLSSSLIYGKITDRNLTGETYIWSPNASTGNYETNETKTTNAATGQTLWLLAKGDELKWLNGGTAVEDYNPTPNLVANPVGGASGAFWWLRSPYGASSDGSAYVWYVIDRGGVGISTVLSYDVSDFEPGVRPAFQIDIA